MRRKASGDQAKPATAAPEIAVPAMEERQVMVSFPVSETLHYALKIRALQEHTTVRGMVMKALKGVGLDVPDSELIDRRPGRAGRKSKGG